MEILRFDHIVLCVADVQRCVEFYSSVLGMKPRQERPGKWSLHFGFNKISLQDAASAPSIARETVPGSGNFCLLTSEPIERFATELQAKGVEIVAGPGEREGAIGKLLSVHFRDPDRNLVEVSNLLSASDP